MSRVTWRALRTELPMGQPDNRAMKHLPLFGLALLRFRPAELVRDGVAYEATTVTLSAFGLRVDLIPK